MAKYRKEPVVIDAVQWRGDNGDEIEEVLGLEIDTTFSDDPLLKEEPYIKWELQIPTLEGDMFACEGDYIVKGVQGEYYPVKPGIFEQTYEEVKEE